MREQSLGEIRFATLARAAEGLTQWRPLLMGFLTLLVTSALVGISVWMLAKAGFFMYLIFMLVSVVALLAGSSAVGIMLMDKAKNEPVRSFAAAASAGLLCLPKFLLVGLVVLVATLAYYLVAAIIYFVCKIPVIGGILAFVAHPVLVLVAAALLIAMIWVIGPLMGPALWSGLSVKAALANVLSIARKRLVEVVLMEVVLYIILTLICVMLFAGLVPATVSLTTMAMGITSGADGMVGMFMGSSRGYGGGYGGAGLSPLGLMMGNAAGSGLVAGLGVMYCVIGALLAQVAIMGMNLIYLQARESVDPAEAEGALDSLIGDVRKKAEEAKAQTMAAAERTMAAAERAKQAAAERLQEATAKNAAADTEPTTEPTAAKSTAAAATAGFTATAADQAQADQQAQELAAAAEARTRQAAEAEAARLRTEAETARLKAEAQSQAERAARERAEALAAEQAARQRADAEAAERAAAQERAAQQKAAEEARLKADAARREAELQAQREAERQAATEREAARIKAQAEAEAKARQTPVLTDCPACKQAVAPDDVFCGECGHKLK